MIFPKRYDLSIILLYILTGSMVFRFKRCALITLAFCLLHCWICCWRTTKGSLFYFHIWKILIPVWCLHWYAIESYSSYAFLTCDWLSRLQAGLPFVVYPIFSALDLCGTYQGLKHVHLQTLSKVSKHSPFYLFYFSSMCSVVSLWDQFVYVPFPCFRD